MNSKNTDIRKLYVISFVIILLFSFISGTWLYFQLEQNNDYTLDSIEKTIIVNESSKKFVKIYFEPSEIKLNLRETATVNVVMSNGSSVAFANLNFQYDENLIKIEDISSKYDMEYSVDHIHNHRLMRNINIKLQFGDVKEEERIAKITLKALQNGKTAFTSLIPSSVYDKNGKSMNLILSEASITVGEEQNIKRSVNLTGLLIFIIFHSAIPLTILLLLISMVIGALLIPLMRLRKKNLEDYANYYFVVSLVLTIFIYILPLPIFVPTVVI